MATKSGVEGYNNNNNIIIIIIIIITVKEMKNHAA